jgi:thiol-disulfide isomerase/thioredoxin
MQRTHRAAVAALAIFVTAACNTSPEKADAPPTATNATSAPAAPSQPAAGSGPVASHGGGGPATFKRPDGSTFTLADMPGKAKVVNVWATWCAPCIGEMPILNAVSKKYASQDVHFVAVSVDENGAADVDPFLKRGRVKIEFPVAFASFEELAAIDVEPPIPDTLVFDAQGKLVKHSDKVIEQPELEAAIGEALSGAAR